MSGMKLWGGRFESGPSEVFERYSWSLDFDKRLVDADTRGSQAFARALRRVGILTGEEAGRLSDAFEEIRQEAENPSYFDGAPDEDVHTFVIRKLKEKVADLAGKIHTGRSRNEQVSLDTRLWLREASALTQSKLADLMAALLDFAGRHPNATVPGYTHLRRAQAVLWPHYLLAYFEMFARDWQRFDHARRAANVMPLGSGALAGSGFPFDREAIARELGFEAVTRNSMDVSADRDFVLDYLYAASVCMIHLSRLAEDWILYSSEEFGWLELSDGVTSGSSLMPQKKNPDSLELLRGKSGRVLGGLNAMLFILKGLPTTYNRDMQEDKEQLFDAADTMLASLDMARTVVESAVLKEAPPLAAAEQSWVVATDLAEALSRHGLPFHAAHQVVGRLVLESVRAGKTPSQWDAGALAAFAPEFSKPGVSEDLARLLDPREGMKTRVVKGGTAPESVRAALAEAAERLRVFRG